MPYSIEQFLPGFEQKIAAGLLAGVKAMALHTQPGPVSAVTMRASRQTNM